MSLPTRAFATEAVMDNSEPLEPMPDLIEEKMLWEMIGSGESAESASFRQTQEPNTYEYVFTFHGKKYKVESCRRFSSNSEKIAFDNFFHYCHKPEMLKRIKERTKEFLVKWQPLFDWVDSFTKEKKLSKTYFVTRYLGLDSIFARHLYGRGGRDHPPSTDSMDAHFLFVLQEFMQKIQEYSADEFNSNDVWNLKFLVEEFPHVNDLSHIQEIEVTNIEANHWDVRVNFFENRVSDLLVSSDELRRKLEQLLTDVTSELMEVKLTATLVTEISVYYSPHNMHRRNTFGGTMTVLDINGYIFGITAKHVFDPENLESININIQRTQTGKFSSENRVNHLFGYSEDFLLHFNLDVGIAIPRMVCEWEPNFVTGIGAIRLPNKSEVLEFKNSMTMSSCDYLVAKHGCATGLTLAKITAVSENSISLRGIEVGPTAFHGDSGSLWIVVKSPGGNLNNLVLAVATTIGIHRNNESFAVDCQAVPVWAWSSWLLTVVEDAKRMTDF